MIISQFMYNIDGAFKVMREAWGVTSPAAEPTPEIRTLLMAIAGQETRWAARVQGGDGPAHSYWQFESEGVAGVMEREGPRLIGVCALLDINPAYAFDAMIYNDTLACTIARLNLWLDPAPLPSMGDITGAWQYYVRNWRPGKPDETRWPGSYRTAQDAVGAATPSS